MRLRRYGLPFANTVIVIVIVIDMVTVVADVNDHIFILGIYATLSRFFFARVFKGLQKV